jgi:hypothetical protein
MSYIQQKMALSGFNRDTPTCQRVRASGGYAWNPQGKCANLKTGAVYPGDQKQSNCMCISDPPKQSGFGAAFEFLKTQLLPGQQQYAGPQGQPSGALTGSGMLLPAVAVVGGVALLLILKKKK